MHRELSKTEIIIGCTGTSLFSSVSGKACGITNINTVMLATLNITKVLKQGSNNNDVKELQKYLNSKGYDCGSPDGSFGLKTKKAVISFQVANKLKGDGIVGKATVSIMK